MKRFIIMFVLCLLSLPLASAQVMHQLSLDVDVHKDGRADVEVFFKFMGEGGGVDLPLFGEIKNLRSSDGRCEVREEIGKILHCEPPSPFMVGEIKIHANFELTEIVKRQDNVSFLSLDVPILWEAEEVIIAVKLPPGMVLTEEALLPLSPSGASVGSDGRRITSTWSLENLKPGDVVPLRMYYEPLAPEFTLSYEWIAAIALIGLIVVIFTYKRFFFKRSELILSVLNEGEKIVVGMIKKSKGRKIDQKKIVKSSGFSKAKVSRIVDSLEERGIVKVEKIGRKNRVSLKKKIS